MQFIYLFNCLINYLNNDYLLLKQIITDKHL